MPDLQNETFRNPYRLLRRPGPRCVAEYPRSRMRTDGYHGCFVCRLTAFSLLEVGGVAARNGTAKEFHRSPVTIPGASIKGMVRSVAEFVGRGCYPCGSVPDNDWSHGGEPVCICCSMFGMRNDGTGLRGKVQVDDGREDADVGAQAAPARRREGYWIYSGTPKMRHSAFYPKGPYQKFYHHQPARVADPNTVQPSVKHAAQLHPVLPGSAFRFRVAFRALDAKQLALLHYALELEPGMLHKLGRGKPHGLGSVQVRVEDIQVMRSPEMYRPDSAPGKELPAEVKEERCRITEDPELDELRRMLAWNADDDNDYSYPGFQWFRDNSQITLRSARELLPEFLPRELEAPNLPERDKAQVSSFEEEVNSFEGISLEYLPNKQVLRFKLPEEKLGYAETDSEMCCEVKGKLEAERLKRLKKKKTLKANIRVQSLGNRHRITEVKPL